jgi:hypothetical protein
MPKKNANPLRRWLSGRHLVSIEAILLVGLLESRIEEYVTGLSVPDPVKTLFIMLFIAGAFGLLISVVALMTKRSLSHGHRVMKQLPLPVPQLSIHLLVLIGMYWLYSRYY